jgi:hypothetical protein
MPDKSPTYCRPESLEIELAVNIRPGAERGSKVEVRG